MCAKVTLLPTVGSNVTTTIVTSTIAAQTGLYRTDQVSTSMEQATMPERNVTSMEPVCAPVPNLYTIAFQTFVFPSLVFNVLLFVAAMFDRMKLQRQNYLFASAISTLMSNIIYMIMLEWILLDNYFETEIKDSVAGQLSFKKMVWVFQEAVTVAMPFLICENIVCLTYVTVNSATYVGRVANMEHTEKSERRFTRIKRFTSTLIVISWTVPFILTIIAMTSMNCVIDCICPSTNFAGKLCPNQTHCSTFWAPVTKAYIWLNVGLWIIAIVGLCTLVGHAILKYQRTTRRPATTVPTITDEQIIPESANNQDIQMSQLNIEQKPKLKRKNTRRSFKHRLNSRLRFALTLTVVFVVCSACFIVGVAIDNAVTEANETLVFALSRITMYIYTTACPIVMVWHLPVLKTSLIKLFHRIRTCCKKPSSPERNRP